MKDTTPSLASGALFSTDISPTPRSTPNIVENTSVMDRLRYSIMS